MPHATTDDGVRLYASPAGRLYLRCDRAPSIQTHPLAAVIGRSALRTLSFSLRRSS